MSKYELLPPEKKTEYYLRRKAAVLAWRAKYPERVKSYNDSYYTKSSGIPQKSYERRNAKIQSKRRSDWKKANYLKVREYASSRHKRKGNRILDYSKILYENRCVCHICGQRIIGKANLHFDHVIPLCKGGEHIESNVKPSHAKCNLSKGKKLISATKET